MFRWNTHIEKHVPVREIKTNKPQVDGVPGTGDTAFIPTGPRL